jgi:hypothetical protein
MGKPGCTQAEVEEAAKMSNAHTFIMNFPGGYDTEVWHCIQRGTSRILRMVGRGGIIDGAALGEGEGRRCRAGQDN